MEGKWTEPKGPVGHQTQNNICIVGATEEKEKGVEKVFEEVIIKSVPNLMKYINTNIQEAQWTPCRDPLPRHIITKLLKAKDKKRILNAERGKWLITYKDLW